MLFHITLRHPAEQCPAGDADALAPWLAAAADPTLQAHTILLGAGCLVFGQGEHATYLLLEADDGRSAIQRVRLHAPPEWPCLAEPVWRLPDDLNQARRVRAALLAAPPRPAEPAFAEAPAAPEIAPSAAEAEEMDEGAMVLPTPLRLEEEFPIAASRTVQIEPEPAPRVLEPALETEDEDMHTLVMPAPLVPQPESPQLHLVAEDGSGAEYRVGQEGATVGRASGNTIRLTEERVSGRHANIELRADGFWVTDLGSTNGTRVNGDRITEPRRLADGDLVQLSRTGFVAHLHS